MLKTIIKTVCLFLLIVNVYLVLPSSVFADDPSSTKSASVAVDLLVRPNPLDIPISISIAPNKNTFDQNEQIDVLLTYGSLLGFDSSMTITAQWTEGTIEGDYHPTLDFLYYLSNSATNAYGNAEPVIDLVNRTITWNIPYYPANLTDQTVQFSLRSAYTEWQKLNFTVTAFLTDLGTTNIASIDKSFQYNPPKDTSTPILPAFAIETIKIRSVSDSGMGIYITTNEQSKIQIDYGLSPESLNKTVLDASLPSQEHYLTFSDLSPDTKYYFKIIATNNDGTAVESDIFTAKTAVVSKPPSIASNAFTVVSDNKILVAPISLAQEELQGPEDKTLVIPQSTIYDCSLSLAEIKPLKSVKIVVRGKSPVLGIETSLFSMLAKAANAQDLTNISAKEAVLTEIQPNVFSGRLISSLPTGRYEMFAIITDEDGNIIETKLSNMKVIDKFTVFSSETKEPVEGARIYLSIYDQKTKKYSPLLPTLMEIVNPTHTDPEGKASIVLPQGKYQALVSELGYKEKTVNFTIGPDQNEEFPVVYLDKEGFNIISIITYYGRTITDIYIYNTFHYFASMSKSARFFNLINTLTLALFVISTFLSFIFRTRIPIKSIFSYLIFHLEKMGRGKTGFYLEGLVTDDDTGRPIKDVIIFLINRTNRQTVKHTSTNANGHFFFSLAKHEDYEILTAIKGYEITPIKEFSRDIDSGKLVRIKLKKAEVKQPTASSLVRLFEFIAGYLFELLLVSSFTFEVLSVPYFGIQRTLPFMLLSGANLLLWILHVNQKNETRRLI